MTRKEAERRKVFKWKMLEQKLMGVVLLILAAILIVMALHGQTPEDKDATPTLFLVPLGLYLIFTKECWIV